MKKLDFLPSSFSNFDREDHWISVSDLMAGLMIIFLFIAVAYMVNVQNEKKNIQEIAVTYQKLQVNLYEDLEREFRQDLIRWNATLDKERLSVRFMVAPKDKNTFREPEILFRVGSDVIEERFQKILKEFINWTKTLNDEKSQNDEHLEAKPKNTINNEKHKGYS